MNPAPLARSWRSLLAPALVAFVVLVGLGTWQVERKAWKETLIASLTERLAASPIALPPAASWPAIDRSGDEYRRVRFQADFDHAKEVLVYGAASAFRPDVSGPGYWVFTPARLADGSDVMVNRGFVPEGRQDPVTRAAGQVAGPVEIVGVLRWPDPRSWFVPVDDPRRNLWFTRDPSTMAAAKGLGRVAPFYVEQESPVPPGGLPQPNRLVVRLRNVHLQYALTWYGLALVLAGIFAAWAVKSGRGPASPSKAQPPHQPPRSL